MGVSQPVSDQQSRNDASTAYTLALITLVVAIIGLGLAYLGSAWFAAQRDGSETATLSDTHIITIGAQHYVVPAALMPNPAQHKDGFSDRIDLTAAIPLGENGRLADVEITLMPRGRVRTSAGLLDSVYLHQFGNAQLQGPRGLVGKPLAGDAGTMGETVWYDPLSATPFVAKCAAPVAMRPDERTCIRTVQLSDRNTAVFAFEPAVLYNWREFDAIIEAWMANLRK